MRPLPLPQRCGPYSAPRPQSVPGAQEAAVRLRSSPLAQTVSVSPGLVVRPCIHRLPGDYQRFPRQGLPQTRSCPPQTARFQRFPRPAGHQRLSSVSPFAPPQRRSLVLLFLGQCQFAETVISRINAGAALTPLGRSGPGPGGRLPTRSAGLFRCSREPEVSLPRRSRARRPHTSRPPPGPTLQSLRSFRVLGHLETQRLAPASKPATIPTTSPAPPPSL